MATHTSVLAWEILWKEQPGGLQFMELQRVGQDRAAQNNKPLLGGFPVTSDQVV